MIDVIFQGIGSAAEPTKVARTFISIHGDVDDLIKLRDAIDAALTGPPGVADCVSMSGVSTRFLVDRYGTPMVGQ